jgi:hypothetical protein
LVDRQSTPDVDGSIAIRNEGVHKGGFFNLKIEIEICAPRFVLEKFRSVALRMRDFDDYSGSIASVTGMEIKEKLSTTAKVAAALIKHGHLATITAVNAVTAARPSSCPPGRSSASRENTFRCSRWRSSRGGISGR